ncbi:MAG: DUF1565 domain-containing protein [Methanosarcinales archaeon]|nr:DUF1565 domain-containing protein [Methanosarcinales archaeon]
MKLIKFIIKEQKLLIFMVIFLTLGFSSIGYASAQTIASCIPGNGKPLAFYSDISNINIHNAGQVVLVGCSNITIQDLNLSNTNIGIELLETNDCKIVNNTMNSNSQCGIWQFFK